MTKILNGDRATARYRHAFIFFVAATTAAGIILGILLRAQAGESRQRDCQVIAAALASGPRHPAPLIALSSQLGCARPPSDRGYPK